MSDPWWDFLEWLNQGDRTYGWGCLVAMDRNRINTLGNSEQVAHQPKMGGLGMPKKPIFSL